MIKYSDRIAKVIFLVIIITWVHRTAAQESKREIKDKKTFIDRVSIGGALGFGFGSNSILVDVSPIIGYSCNR